MHLDNSDFPSENHMDLMKLPVQKYGQTDRDAEASAQKYFPSHWGQILFQNFSFN